LCGSASTILWRMRLRAWPNCMASRAAMEAISWLTPENVQSTISCGHQFHCGTMPMGLMHLVSSIGSTTHCLALTMLAMSACRKLWLQANLWGPLFTAVCSCVAIHGRVWSTIGMPWWQYWCNRPLAGWFMCIRSVRLPWPLFAAANCFRPMLCTTTLSIQINSPSSLFICFWVLLCP